MPADYPRFLEEAKHAVSVAQSQAALAVVLANSEPALQTS